MKLFATAVLSCLATNSVWLVKDHVKETEWWRAKFGSVDEDAEAEDVEQEEQQQPQIPQEAPEKQPEQQVGEQQKEVEPKAPEPPAPPRRAPRPKRKAAPKAEPVPDVAHSAQHILQFSADLLQFAFEPALALLRRQPTADAATDQRQNQMASEFVSQLLDTTGTSITAVGDVVGGLCPESVNANNFCKAAVASWQGVLGGARRTSVAWLQRFVERYPQHSKALSGQDPVIVVLVCLVLVAFVLLDLYISYRCIRCILWAFLSAVCSMFTSCCCRGSSDAPSTSADEGRPVAIQAEVLEIPELTTLPAQTKKGNKSQAVGAAPAAAPASAQAPVAAPLVDPVSPTSSLAAPTSPTSPEPPTAPTSPTSPTSPTEGSKRQPKKRKEKAAKAAAEVVEVAAKTEEKPSRQSLGKNAFALLNSDSD